MLLRSLVSLVLGCTAVAADLMAHTPVVLWHGMGDTCCLPFSMGNIQKHIESEAKERGLSVFVHSIRIGSNEAVDEVEGFFGNMNHQVAAVCEQLRQIPALQGGFNAIGFSQGGQLMRAYVQRCNNPPVKTLITMGGQHLGVSEVPGCIGPNLPLCKQMAELLGKGAYLPGVRDVSIQAQYFRAPTEKAAYLKHNIFLPDINNERPALEGGSDAARRDRVRRQTYKDNLSSLDKLVLIMFEYDFVVVPRESSWFGTFAWGKLDRGSLLRMNETDIYKGDYIGLKALDQAGKIDFKTCPAMHMKFTMDYFKAEVLEPYLLPPKGDEVKMEVGTDVYI